MWMESSLAMRLLLRSFPQGGGRGMLYMGSDISGITGYELTGAMDEVCLFNTVLNSDQLGQMVESKSCVLDEETGPVDTGSDTGDAGSDTGDTGNGTEGGAEDGGTTGRDSGQDGADSAGASDEGGLSTGCGCASSKDGSVRHVWLFGLLGLLVWRRRGTHP